MNHSFDDNLRDEDIEWFRPFIKIATGSGDYIKTEITDDYKGIDVYANGIPVQCKKRDTFYNYDMCIELAHRDVETGKWWKGWIHEYPKSEKLLYGWKHCYRGKDDICLIMDSVKLHEAYINNKESWDKRKRKNKYPSKDNRGRSWWTWCAYIPIKELRKYLPVGHYSKPLIK